MKNNNCNQQALQQIGKVKTGKSFKFEPYLISFFYGTLIFSKFYFFRHENLLDVVLTDSLNLIIG